MMKQLTVGRRWSVMLMALVVVAACAIMYPKSVHAAETGDTVWLHVINGNFSGIYNGENISKAASVEVKLDADRTLPKNVEGITVNRTNGTFDGWYTRSAREVLEDRENGAYCVWHTERKNGNKIEPGSGRVPEDVNVLYAVFDDKDKEEIADSDKLVVYYLDWNGINGLYGHCLTSIRSYNNGSVHFNADSAAVFHLNYKSEFDDQFRSASDKWGVLKTIWAANEFDGYTFLGWSDTPHGETIWKDTQIQNGMSFYAQWEKGELSSKNFERAEDPNAGPLQTIRMTGDGLNANLSASRHAKAGETITLTMLRNPIRAEAKDITWNLSIGNGSLKSEKVTVKADGVSVYHPKEEGAGLEFRAEGYTLTIRNLDGGEYGMIVGVTAKAANEDGQTLSAPANATIGFSHTWDRGEVTKQADCENGGTIHYTCTAEDCEEEKDKAVSPLAHVYETSLDEPHCYKIIEDPTCTEDGVKQYKCLRCGQANGAKAAIPATGHDWKMTGATPLNCQKTQYTDTCKNPDCSETRTRDENVSNPMLHHFEETVIPMNCSKATLRKTCSDCGLTTNLTIDCSNPDAPHVWGDWAVTTEPTLEAAGEQTRTCHLCKEEETEVIPQLTEDPIPEEQYPADQAPSGQTPEAEVKPEEKSESAVPESEKLQNDDTSGAVKPEEKSENAVSESEKLQSANTSGEVKFSKETVSQPVSAKNNDSDTDSAKKTAKETVKKSKVKTGWQTVGKKKYYYNAKGTMLKNGIKTIKGKKYYFDKKGVMKTGWKVVKGKKYYFGSNGVMKTGKQKIGGKIYTFKSNGVLRK